MALPWGSGTGIGAPIRSQIQSAIKRSMVEDQIYRGHPYAFFDVFTDFEEAPSGGTSGQSSFALLDIASSADINQIPVTTGANTVGYFTAPRAGVLSAASMVANSNLATSNTNYVTFTITNLGPAGAGSTVMLATTPAGVNSTQTTGGTAIAAGVPFVLTLTSTAANLAVNAGDVLKVIVTTTGTLANVVDTPTMFLSIAGVGGATGIWQPFTFRTAGSPTVAPVANGLYGQVSLQLSATSEAQTAGISWGDSLLLNKPDVGSGIVNTDAQNYRVFECYFQIPVALTTNQRLLMGVGTAMNATNTSITDILAFHFEANMTPTGDARDGTNTSNQTTFARPLTLAAGTWVRASIDWVDIFNVRFRLDDHSLGTLSVGAWTNLIKVQPFIYLQKSSGVTTPQVLVDYMRGQCRRF